MDVKTIAIIIALVIAAIGFYQKVQHRKEGSTLSRARDFVEYSETFTLRHLADGELTSAFKAAQPGAKAGVTMHGNAQQVVFEGPFGAVLSRTENTDEKSVYVFKFTNWKSRYGSPLYAEDMNLLLTAVEKIFVSLDPNTQVSTKKEDITTKRPIF
ncbi:hypothetical protein H6A07_07905 [Olsenella uli]|uniref:hypothetical protein n=1 Tax=Olsenella uli TaxID=133926 RepID=UPI00195ED58B|nr:hypothetical protein [Olsenella uli]MBM6676663.1 hypothetical protein [Olsenella uli]